MHKTRKYKARKYKTYIAALPMHLIEYSEWMIDLLNEICYRPYDIIFIIYIGELGKSERRKRDDNHFSH